MIYYLYPFFSSQMIGETVSHLRNTTVIRTYTQLIATTNTTTLSAKQQEDQLARDPTTNSHNGSRICKTSTRVLSNNLAGNPQILLIIILFQSIMHNSFHRTSKTGPRRLETRKQRPLNQTTGIVILLSIRTSGSSSPRIWTNLWITTTSGSKVPTVGKIHQSTIITTGNSPIRIMEIAKPTGSMKIGPHGGLHHRAGLPSGQTITGNRRPGPLPKNRTPGGEAVEMIRSLCGRRRRQHLDDTDHLLPRNHRGSPSANSVSENKFCSYYIIRTSLRC